jgi:hypothetical protein
VGLLPDFQIARRTPRPAAVTPLAKSVASANLQSTLGTAATRGPVKWSAFHGDTIDESPGLGGGGIDVQDHLQCAAEDDLTVRISSTHGEIVVRDFFTATCFLSLLGLAHGENAVTIQTPHGARQPQVCIDANGIAHLAFGADGQVFYTCSTDAGATYRQPSQVAKLQSLALGMRRGPRIAVSGDAIVIAAIGGSTDHLGDGNLFTWRSNDQGESWQGPLQVNDVNASAREGLHGMAAGPNGELYCTWLDLRDKGTQIFGSRSTDGGVTWSKNCFIYRSPDGTVCECCHPSVALDATGAVYVMWRNSLDGNRDMFLASSHDHGETFEPAAKLGEGSWPLNACPMDGGANATSASGKIIAVWRRDHDIFLTDGGYLNEQRLGIGMQPWVTADQHRFYAVWLSSRTGKLYLAKSANGQPVELADHAQFPVVTAHPSGRGPVVVAWESEGDTGPLIKVVSIDRE